MYTMRLFYTKISCLHIAKLSFAKFGTSSPKWQNQNYAYKTVHEVKLQWEKRFFENRVLNPTESIELILTHLLKNEVSDVLTTAEINQIDLMCKERMKHVPVPYLTKHLKFRSLNLKMSPPVFIPQPQTEMITDIVVKEIDSQNINRAIELCCGSGAISLSILQERPQMKILAFDHLSECCKLTRENAEINNLSTRLEIENVKIGSENCVPENYEKLDLIVSNPPYVPKDDYKRLPDEYLLYQDLTAQDGGDDGMKMMIPVLNFSSVVLNNGGKLILEVHPAVSKQLKNYLQKNQHLKLQYVRTFPGSYGEERFLKIIKIK